MTSNGMRIRTKLKREGGRSRVALKDFATGLGFDFMAKMEKRNWKGDFVLRRRFCGYVAGKEGTTSHRSIPADKGARAKPACAALFIRLGRLGSGALGEAGDGFRF